MVSLLFHNIYFLKRLSMPSGQKVKHIIRSKVKRFTRLKGQAYLKVKDQKVKHVIRSKVSRVLLCPRPRKSYLLPDDKIFDWTKLKEVADNTLKFD